MSLFTPVRMQLTEAPPQLFERILNEIGRVVIGKRAQLEHILIATAAGGHLLLEDVPGVGKTMLVKALARTIDLQFKRVQFTPDLLPSDVTGISVFNQKTGDFEFREGPLTANLVLADELNRSSPRTQSALLEAMEERSVTVDGTTYELPRPFHVFATQNPLDYEGTYALPEAQVDRFMLRVRLGYPDRDEERTMLERHGGQHPLNKLRPVLLAEELVELQHQVREVFVDDSVKDYMIALARQTRHHKEIRLGVSPRGTLALYRACQALALLSGRTFVTPDDVKRMAMPVFAHRVVLSHEARSYGKTAEQLLPALLQAVPVPALRYAAAK